MQIVQQEPELSIFGLHWIMQLNTLLCCSTHIYPRPWATPSTSMLHAASGLGTRLGHINFIYILINFMFVIAVHVLYYTVGQSTVYNKDGSSMWVYTVFIIHCASGLSAKVFESSCIHAQRLKHNLRNPLIHSYICVHILVYVCARVYQPEALLHISSDRVCLYKLFTTSCDAVGIMW